MRDFSTGDAEDLTLEIDTLLSASLRITVGNESPVKKLDAELCLKMDGCEEESASTSIAYSSLLLVAVIISHVFA